MILDEYLLSKNEIVNNFSTKSKMWQEDIMVAKFNIVSASLSNYLPGINHSEHENIFKNIMLHQQLSIFEQSFYDLPDYVAYENFNPEIRNLLKKGGNIICTFHTGSYRLINLFLAKHDISYSLVLSKEAIETQGVLFHKIFDDLNENRTEKLDLNMIDAESPVSMLQMIKTLKRGGNLVIYIDGNSGAGSETINNQNHCSIDFLNQKIFARQGVGFISHMLNVPVLTVASFRKSYNDIRLRFFDPIFSDAHEERAIAARKTTGLIFDLISPIIRDYPEQWEAWLYLDKVANITYESNDKPREQIVFPEANDKLVFNFSCFGIFKIVKHPFLFQKRNYKSYRISTKVYSQLTKCMTGPVLRKNINIPEFKELYENKVLVYAPYA